MLAKVIVVLVVLVIIRVVWGLKILFRLFGRMHVDLIELAKAETKSERNIVYAERLQYFVSETAWKLKRAKLIEGSASRVVSIDVDVLARVARVKFAEDNPPERIDFRNGLISRELFRQLLDLDLAVKLFGNRKKTA